MRKLILSLALLLSSSTGWSFSDALTNDQLDSSLRAMKTEARLEYRIRTLEKFRDYLNQRLNTIDMAAIEADPDGFASLNEFYGFIGQIETKSLTPASCKTTRDQMILLARDNGLSQAGATESLSTAQFPEATESLRLLSALCGH